MGEPNLNTTEDLNKLMETTMQNLQSKFQAMSDQIVSRMDEMGSRVDELEKNVADLMTKAGMEGPQSVDKPHE